MIGATLFLSPGGTYIVELFKVFMLSSLKKQLILYLEGKRFYEVVFYFSCHVLKKALHELCHGLFVNAFQTHCFLLKYMNSFLKYLGKESVGPCLSKKFPRMPNITNISYKAALANILAERQR